MTIIQFQKIDRAQNLSHVTKDDVVTVEILHMHAIQPLLMTKVQKTTRQVGLEALIHENVVSCPGKRIVLVVRGP